MTNEIENLHNLATKLIETGQKLREEATQKALYENNKELSIPEGKNILTGFTWELDLMRPSPSGWWAFIKGTPATERAKALIAAAQSSVSMDSVWDFLQKQVNNIGKPHKLAMHTAYLGGGNFPYLIWCLGSIEELERWLKSHPHLEITNLSNTIKKVIPSLIVQKQREVKIFETKCGQLSELASSLRKIQKGESAPQETVTTVTPVSLNAVNWEEVARGNQEAPPLLEKEGFGKKKAGTWIYVLSPHRQDPRLHWRWDHSPESCPSENGGISLAQAISRVHKENPSGPLYVALYRHIGEGIAELVTWNTDCS